MKRKNSCCATEATFDSLMANSTEVELNKKLNFDSGSSQSSSPVKKSQSLHNRAEVLPSMVVCCLVSCPGFSCTPSSESLADEDGVHSEEETSECEASDSEAKNEVTTLRMLFEKVRSPDADFYDACLDIGLLNPSSRACVKCNVESFLIGVETNEDRLMHRCDSCDLEWSVRRDSWIEDTDVSIKDIILIIYCWCKGYSLDLTAHEIGISTALINELFSKCSSVADNYYQNPLSNIGGPNKTIITDIFTYNDRLILGFCETDSKNVYFTILTGDYDENRIVTILIDNLAKGSSIVTRENSRVTQILDEECIAFLQDSWDIYFKTESVTTDSLILLWTEFEQSLPPANNFDPAFSDIDPQATLRLALFKNRMNGSKDSFLFFLTVVSYLFNNTNTES